MADTQRARGLPRPERPPAIGKPWWKELLHRQAPGVHPPALRAPACGGRSGATPGALSPPGLEQRQVWTAQMREYHREGFGAASYPPTFYPLTAFYVRLGEELDLAKRHGKPLAVVVLQLPDLGVRGQEGRWQRELETALRLCVRSKDLPARLSPTTLAVGLPHTDATAGGVALRLQRVLSPLSGGQIVVGTACFPADGATALALLRAAAWRSMTALSGSPPDPGLTQLLGPINPGMVLRPST